MTPTAEEFLKENSRLRNILVIENTTNLMIEFAKLHCIAQAKVISENAKLTVDGDLEDNIHQRYVVESGNHYCETELDISKESILKAYDLNLIK